MTPEDDSAPTLEARRQSLSGVQAMAPILRLSSGLGHEFNNLMQTTVGALQLIQKLNEAGRAAETTPFIASAMKAAQKASALNQQVASLARDRPPKSEPADLNVIVTDMSNLLRHAMPNAVTFSTELAPEALPIHCDPRRARLAVLDLCFHGLDAMPGCRAVSVVTRGLHVGDEGVPPAGLAAGSYVCVEARCSNGQVPDEAPQSTRSDVHREPHGSEALQEFARSQGGAASFDPRAGTTTLYLRRLAREAGVEPKSPAEG